jgi:hypothetical protein
MLTELWPFCTDAHCPESNWATSQVYIVECVPDRDVVPLRDVTPPSAL